MKNFSSSANHGGRQYYIIIMKNRDMKNLNNWLSANKISLNVVKTELVIFKFPRKVLLDEIKIKLCGKRLYPSKSAKNLGIKIGRFLHSA